MKKGMLRKRILIRLMLLTMMIFSFSAGAHQNAQAAIRGIDVSLWQGKIDWKKVKNAGIKFVMLGAGHYYYSGSNKGPHYDPYFKYNIQNALRNGVHVGIYFYSNAMTDAQARNDAEFVLKQIQGYNITYPVAFDIEDPAQMKLTTQQRTSMTKAFLNIIEMEGYTPMIYASENWFKTQMDLTQLTRYDKWIANWHSKPTVTAFGMWQYSSTGRISGINGAVDLDYSYKDYTKSVTPRKTRATTENAKTKSGWVKNSKGQYQYYMSNGKLAKKTFITIDGKRYFFDKNGLRSTGMKKIGGKYYYFDPADGALAYGSFVRNGHFYYSDLKTGVVKQKSLVKENGKYYYYKNNGQRASGWTVINKKYYYFKPDTGDMVRGFLKLKGKTYYLQKNGVRYKGWLKYKGKVYYFSNAGYMYTNRKVNGYQFDKNGVCKNPPKKYR